MALPRLNYVVLDANQLGKSGAIEGLIEEYRASGQLVMLPWVHLYEQSKASTATSFDMAHNRMRAEPAAFSVTKATLEIIQAELQAGPQLALEAIEDAPEGAALRAFLSDRRPTADISKMAARVEHAFHSVHQPGWASLLRTGVAVNDEAVAKQIRKGLHSGDPGPLRDAVVAYYRGGRLEATLRELLADNPAPKNDASPLLRYPSMSALTVLTYFCLGLRWQFKTPKKQHEDNPACDTEAVLIALYGRMLITDDGEARALDADVRAVASAIWP